MEQREDATNINNWHWVSIDALGWARSYLTEALPKIAIADPDRRMSAKITTVTSVDGDCTVHNRKNRVFHTYDMAVTMAWEGELESHPVKGSITVPEVAHDSVPEVRVAKKSIEVASF